MNEINSILMLLIVLAIWEVVKSVFIFFRVNSDMKQLEKTTTVYKQKHDQMSEAYSALCMENLSVRAKLDRLSETEKELRAERNNLLKIVEELTPKEKAMKTDNPFLDPMYLRKKPKAKKV